MALDLAKLEKILKLEAADNFQDRRVMRGLAAFIGFWLEDSRKGPLEERETALLALVNRSLLAYGQLDQERRKEAIAEVLRATAVFTGSPLNGLTLNGLNPAAFSPLSPPPVPFKEPVAGSRALSNPASRASKPIANRLDYTEEKTPRLEEAAPQPEKPPALSLHNRAKSPSRAGAASNSPSPGHNILAATRSQSGPGGTAALAKAKEVPPPDLDQPLRVVKGVGETYSRLLEFVQLRTIREALFYFPFRHEDFSSFKKISELMFGNTESVVASVLDVAGVRTRGGKEMIEVVVSDETGSLRCIFFNRRMIYGLKPGSKVVLSGRVEQWNGQICLKSPQFETFDTNLTHTGRFVPVYPTAGPLKPAALRRLIKLCVDKYAHLLPDHLPAELRARNNLPGLSGAVADYHYPPGKRELETARRRLAFDELFQIHLGILLKRREWQEKGLAAAIPADHKLLEDWYAYLPFKLTGDQLKVIADVLKGVANPVPMRRLVQGDVGSGKTIVAATALLMSAAAGFQGALMAPTQILAEQHFQGLSRLFKGFGEKYPERHFRLELLTGNVKKKGPLYQEISEGRVDIVIGTQALIQEGVEFSSLGLVIHDEQHRFGVVQRYTLKAKGEETNPHVLSMTATPIPRSLNLTLYGGLDVSVIEEMPPGRIPIATKFVRQVDRENAYNFIRREIQAGRQAFIICPLVEESDKIEAKAAVEEHARLQQETYPDLKLGLLHGRMKPVEKEKIMAQFREGEFDILVATSVIEVGIDIPNASVILIEGADRFGLAQLHQFRGRVGRGKYKSYCLLLGSPEVGEEGQKRLKIIEKTSNGFELAEEDLKLRGPGEFFGTRQSGLPELRIAGLHDMPLLEHTRKEAQALLERDPDLSRPEHALLAQKVKELWERGEDIS